MAQRWPDAIVGEDRKLQEAGKKPPALGGEGGGSGRCLEHEIVGQPRAIRVGYRRTSEDEKHRHS